MTTRRAADVRSALIAKGMVVDESHHTMFRMDVDGVTTVVTRISHGCSEINDHLGMMMGKQCVLQLREFWDLVDCPLSAADWRKLIAERCDGGVNPFRQR